MKRLLLVLTLLLATSCARPPVEPLPLYPELPQQLLAEAKALGTSYASLKSLARVAISYRDETRSFSQALLLEKPDRLRMDVLSPFGSTFLQASSDGDVLRLYIPSKGDFFSGEPSPENFQLLTRIPIRVPLMVALLLYDVPLISERVAAVSARGSEGYALTLAAGDDRQELWFDRQRRLVASAWFRGEELLARLEYGALLGAPPFPREIEFTQPASAASLKIVYDNPQPNAAIAGGMFRIEPPTGVPVAPFPRPTGAPLQKDE